MGLVRIELEDFRCFTKTSIEPDPQGITVFTGVNGSGKTSILEALWYLGHGASFRSSKREALVRSASDVAYTRAFFSEDGRSSSFAAEIPRTGRAKITMNAQSVRSRRMLAEHLPLTLFSPEDIVVVRGAPAARRELLDNALLTLSSPAGAAVEAYEQVLRQRTALLRQAQGRLSSQDSAALDIWDQQLAEAGKALADFRNALLLELQPLASSCYELLAGSAKAKLRLLLLPSYEGDLLSALTAARGEDLRRGLSSKGPHRDDVLVELDGMDSRLQASQGEQRCLALALRLAVHRLVTAKLGKAPILLLDDVFSELDEGRSIALAAGVPPGQSLVTSAVHLPPSMVVDLEIAMGNSSDLADV